MSVLQLFNDEPSENTSKTAGICALLVLANVLAWIWALLALADRPALFATAFLAYTFGLRHAVDADHIAAIDNVVRKLMQEGKRPLSAGFFFSLGHSTVVVLAAIGIAATTTALQTRFAAFKALGGIIGTGVSVFFLLTIAIVNLVIVSGLWRSFQHLRRGGRIEIDHLNALLAGRGFLSRLFRGLFRIISKSWHMYPLGLLFALGFDTATEIGLLGLSAAQAAQGISLWSILIFPALFTAAMVLVDTVDGLFMVGAYGWAFTSPLRKLWYNLTVTAMSVLIALFIGSLEVLGLLADRLGMEGRFWAAVGNLNGSLGAFGLLAIGAFVLCWLGSALILGWKGCDLGRVPLA
ncbi:MAG TPA: HoxN/HupN/NixA family nickel/cobalt transporter [Xanthobacteraceae bacterium]|jgi:high-affinity nickel-transport protein